MFFTLEGEVILSNWSAKDLERRLCRALDVAHVTVKFFSSSGYTNPIRDELSFSVDKPLAETAMLLYAASACRNLESINARIDRIAHDLIKYARTEKVALNIALHPSQTLKLALPHIILSKLGYSDTQFDHFIGVAIASQAHRGEDKLHSATYERQWISNLWKNGASWIDLNLNARESLLFCPVDLIGGRREDAYGFTHLMMYSTDFGFHSTKFPGNVDFALDQASSLLAKCIESEDYDLAGELLLTWPLTGSKWDPQAVFAFRLLATLEDKIGFLPCANIDLPYLSTLEGLQRERYAVASSYHTIYVMGFLAATSLKPGMAPPQTIIGPRPKASCLERVMNFIDISKGHWHSVFLTLSESEQETLTRFVFDLGISQTCVDKDYPRLAKLLSLASETGLPDSLISIQAKELLGRFTECARLTGKNIF